LEDIEDGTILLFYKNSGGSPWINRYDEAENWLREKEEACLNIDNIGRPNTKWVFRGYSDVDVKVMLDRQPLLGTGPLPDWLPNFARGCTGPMVALDTYQDNLCLLSLRYTTEQDQIEAQEQHESSQKVSLNSELLQTTARKYHLMNLIGLKDT